MSSLALVLLAAALALLPGRNRSAGRRRQRAPGQALPRARPGSVGPAATAVLVALAVLLLLGPRAGVPAAVVAGPLTAWGLRRWWLRSARSRSSDPDPALALTLDLAAAALRSGRPLAEALRLAAPAAGPEVAAAFDRVAVLSRLGADATQAWSGLARDGPLGEVAAVAVRSAASGIRLASSFERLAGQLRADRATEAAARAQRAAVVALAPLAACFLPSFVCLGVVPVVVGLARGALAGLP